MLNQKDEAGVRCPHLAIWIPPRVQPKRTPWGCIAWKSKLSDPFPYLLRILSFGSALRTRSVTIVIRQERDQFILVEAMAAIMELGRRVTFSSTSCRIAGWGLTFGVRIGQGGHSDLVDFNVAQEAVVPSTSIGEVAHGSAHVSAEE